MAIFVDNLTPEIDNFLKLTHNTAMDWEGKPEPGKWSNKEIIGHLCDSALINLQRFVRCTYEENFKLVYEQDEWVAAQHYQTMPVDDLLQLWRSLNKQIARVLSDYPPGRWPAQCDSGRMGVVFHTAEWLAMDYVVHLKHHLNQIQVLIMSALTETWLIHNRINLYLLDAIDEANLKDISASKGRNVGEQFAHMHNVRLMWLNAADPALLEGLTKIEKEEISKEGLITALNQSAEAISRLLEQSDGKIKGFKPHATAFWLFDLSRVASPRTNYAGAEAIGGTPQIKKYNTDYGNGGEVMQTAGYSGTPLAKKLGIKDGFFIELVNAPDYYLQLFTDLPPNLYFENKGDAKIDFIHFFTKSKAEYEASLPALKEKIKSNGIIWISWPKKSSKVVTDISENDIRNFALKTGLVDIKVCAVDDTWSGLKLVIPVKDRG